MAIPAEMYITLQKIIMFAQEKKLELLRGGRGVEEPMQSDEPQLEDMRPKELVAQSEYKAPPKLVHTDEGLPSPSSAPALPSPSSISDILKADDDKQLSLEEVLHNIEKAESQPVEPKPTDVDEYPSLTIHAEEAPKDIPNGDDNEELYDMPYSRWQRFKDWRQARQNWHMEKWRKDYEYACKKQQIKDMCVGYDEIIAYVKQLMSDWDDIAAEDNIADAPNVTISGVHDGLGA